MWGTSSRHRISPAVSNATADMGNSSIKNFVDILTNMTTCLREGRSYKPRNHNAIEKTTLYTACCVVCTPCFAWSVVWRVLACPFQCLFKEPVYACSNNICTIMCDRCIGDTIDFINLPEQMPILPDIKTICLQDALALKRALVVFSDAFNKIYLAYKCYIGIHYDLCNILDYTVMKMLGSTKGAVLRPVNLCTKFDQIINILKIEHGL